MDRLARAIELAMERYREECGQDVKLLDGDEFATVFNDCTLIISLDGGCLKTRFVFGEPLRINETIGVWGQDGTEESEEEHNGKS